MMELLAPNGKPSNLSPEQYELVRKPEFKAWFGDWENNPSEASKVVDYNGEPLEVYHGTDAEFNVFDGGAYFTDDYMNADGYAGGENVFHIFLNIKKPLIFNANRRKWDNLNSKYGSSTQEIVSNLDEKKYDGVIFNNINDNFWDDKGSPQNVYYAINPEQIKLSDGSNTTFDGNNTDIRFNEGGSVDNKYQYVVDEIENAIIGLGLPYLKEVDEFNRYYLSKSKNDFGQSWYMIFLQENRPLEIRISDHSVTSSLRIMDDKYIAMLDVNNPFKYTTAKGIAKSLDLEFKRLKDIREKRNKLFDDEREKRNYMNNELQSFLDKLKSENKTIGKNERTYQTLEEVTTKHPDWEYVFHYPNNGAYSFYFVKNDMSGSLSPNFINEQYFNFLNDNNYLKTNYKTGGRTIAQTPAPKKDQIKGSDKNKEGSAKDISSAKKIKFSDDVLEKIQNSVDKHNKKHPDKKITIDSAKAVVRRGMGAYSSTHRPTISGGNENSRVAWGLARLNAFLYKIVNGKSKSGKYSQDNDLIEELGYKVQKYEIGGIFQGTPYDFNAYSTEYMGTGEGNQVFGWGLYFTDQKAIAERYAYMPNENSFYINGISLKNSKQFTQEEKDIILNIWRELWEMGYSETSSDYLFEILNELEQKSTLLDEEDESVFDKETILELNQDAKLYNDLFDKLKNSDLEINSNVVNVTLFKGKNPNQYNLLNWNEKPNKKIINLILNGLNKKGIEYQINENSIKFKRSDGITMDIDLVNGNTLYNGTSSVFFSDDKEASLFLLNAGIDGIKYKSGTLSGMADKEGYNYVIFNGDDVTIESKEKFADGGEINKNMKNEIIDILSKNARYGKEILSVQEVGLEVIQSCIESNTYFGNAIRQANDNYIMIPVKYDDKLWAIDKKVEYVYFAKPNENTKIRVEYKYDIQEYPTPILFDSEIMNNEEFYNVNDYEEINVREFDSEFLYRGINNDEMLSIIENGFIKSNASMNIGKQQEETTSFAQHISQASSYAVGFNAWYDEVTFNKPKYILKVKKEGVNYKPTIETDIENEVDVFGEIPIQQIESIYEFRLGECQMGSVEINVGYENNFSEGSRFPMYKKVFVRKMDVNNLINEINSKNKIEKNNNMTNSNPKDTITMDIPLLIRFSELMREEIKTDVALHEVVENLLEIKDKGVLTMSDYDSIVGNVTGTEEDVEQVIQPEKEKMSEGGKVQSIHSAKGDIKINLDENWYSDDTKVQLVPVSELIKFREFDRKVSPKYNQENSKDNINHLKYMFQKEGVKSPLIIEYSPKENSVLIIEGNHRLNSAIDLGMEFLPARVVLKKYGTYSPEKLKSTMKVSGVTADESGYISSDLKPSQVGIEGTMPIYADGGIIEGRLHSECGDDGCGRKFQVGENGHVIEAERDEAVIVADAFDDNENYTIKGTPSEVASAINVIGGGKNFDRGATIIKKGQELEIPQLKKQATDTDVADVIDSGSIIINRRSMADEKEYEVTGTPKQIASAINSINGNGVIIEEGAEIKEN